MPTYPIIPQSIPVGECPSDLQSILNLFSANQFVNIPQSVSGLVISAAKPTDHTVAWLQLDQFGQPVRLYYFAQGAWLSKHTIEPGLSMWWFKSLPPDPTTFLNTFDGGDANAPSALSGPMWQLAKNPNGTVISAQFLMVAGTLPSGKVLSVGDAGGNETITQTADQVAPHSHGITGKEYTSDEQATMKVIIDDDWAMGNADTTASTDLSTANGATPPVANPMNILPLYTVAYVLERTSRRFYAVT